MQDQSQDDASSSRRRLIYNREQFDDYWIALMSKLRINEDADALISGRSPHPLLSFQRANLASLRLLGVLILTANQLIEDPFGTYQRFTEYLGEALHRHPGPVPTIGNLNDLEESYQIHRRAQRHIYATTLDTLQVGISMHYARRVQFGAGLHLLNVIRSDNRQVTTRSLMALFSALLSLQLKPSETFEQFSRRIDLLIQRLLNWRPPVVLPDQLLLFCALRALPDVPYGPVRHIILASPDVTFFTGMNMLRDVANTGAKLIQNTLGSGLKTEPSSVLCADPCPASAGDSRSPSHHHKSRRTPAGRRSRPRRQRGPSKLCVKEGPCIHHGPHSFHATSECRDPTLSRTKKAQPRSTASTPSDPKLAGIATTTQATPAPDHVSDTTARNQRSTDVMYSPVFLTQISSSAKYNARTQFLPHRRHDINLRRGRHQQRSTRTRYHPRTISRDTLHSCIRTYTRPIHGECIPDFRSNHPGIKYNQRRCKYNRIKRSTPQSRRQLYRRKRRRVRNWRNRSTLYPNGVLKPARQRQPRKFSPGPAAGAKDRRRRRRQQQRPANASTSPLPPHLHEPSNLPLPLSISLLVSCSSCGYSAELPWSHSTTHTSPLSASPVYDIPLKPPRRQTFSARKRWNKWHRKVSERNRFREPAYPKWCPPTVSIQSPSTSRTTKPRTRPVRNSRHSACRRSCQKSSHSSGNCSSFQSKRHCSSSCAKSSRPTQPPVSSRSPSSRPHHPKAPAPDRLHIRVTSSVQTPSVPFFSAPKPNTVDASNKSPSPPGPAWPGVAYIEQVLAMSSPPAPPTRSVPSPEELEHAALCALHRPPAPNESLLESHLRIGAAFAASAQLEELRFAKHHSRTDCPPYFVPGDVSYHPDIFDSNSSTFGFPQPASSVSVSTCLLGDVHHTSAPASGSPVTTTTSHANASTTSTATSRSTTSIPVAATLTPSTNHPAPASTTVPLPAASATLPTTPTRPKKSSNTDQWNKASPYDSAYTFSEAEYINLVSSDESTAPAIPPPKKASKRRFKGHNWSRKGSKLSRRLDRQSRSKSESAHCSTANNLVPPSASNPNKPTPTDSATRKPYYSSKSALPFTVHNVTTESFKTDHAAVHNVTDHASKSKKYIPPSGANQEGSKPPSSSTKKLRATYAWADGLHTTLHYPHEFYVTLRGQPVISRHGTVIPPTLSGDPGPATAISAVINTYNDRPMSFCKHANCIYNKGDLIARRRRHLLSVRKIDTLLGRPQSRPPSSSSASKPQGTINSKCLLTSSSRHNKLVLDSGASRHIEVLRSRLRNLHSCSPVLLQGINGDSFNITEEGSCGHCHNVLLAPKASASVRSVSALIDSHRVYILFTDNAAYILPPFSYQDHKPVIIAKRKSDGLFHIAPNSVPPASPTAEAHAYLSVPQQIKREAIHALHRILGHASPRRMRQALTNHPELNTSLAPNDVRLFTHCDACEIGNSSRPAAPEKADVRATAIGYRIHLDTSGTVRPQTSSGFTRVLIAVDDASRWIFISLLRNATMGVVAAAMRAILRKVAGDHSVLRTKIIRTDNGKEFCNRLVDALLAESDIQRELTCVGTSHQNGVAERAIGIVFAIARTLIVDASLPAEFWGEAVITAVYLRNRLPCSANPGNISPFEARYGRRPDLRHLRPFGVSAFVRIQKHLTKVQARAIKGIFIGYGESVSAQKG